MSGLRPLTPRLEAALDFITALPCDHCDGLVYYPGWWCDDCQRGPYPLLLLDCDFEPNGDDEPEDYC
jgi:hypothetical protein